MLIICICHKLINVSQIDNLANLKSQFRVLNFYITEWIDLLSNLRFLGKLLMFSFSSTKKKKKNKKNSGQVAITLLYSRCRVGQCNECVLNWNSMKNHYIR